MRAQRSSVGQLVTKLHFLNELPNHLVFAFDQKVQCTYAFLQVAFELTRKEVKSYQCALAI